jgi:multidrug resistance efflux pump
MNNNSFLDLGDCTDYAQALRDRPPRVVHGTAFLLIALLGAAICWTSLTRADLVVRAAGRVRPIQTAEKVFSAARGEVSSGSVAGRVVEVRFKQGGAVRRGDVLIRLDTARLDNEIDRQRRAIRAAEQELAQMGRLERLHRQQFEAARSRAEAELAQARTEVRQAQQRQAEDIRIAVAELSSAEDELVRARRLALSGAVPPAEVVKIRGRASEARAKRDRARLRIDDTPVEVRRRALVLLEKEDAVKREELAIKRVVKQAELESARLQLANLDLERGHTVLRAPVDGVVTSLDVKVGDVLEPGKAVVEIAEQKGFRFEALVPSEEVAHLSVGMPARVRLDAYDFQKYGCVEGTVCFISPDSEAADGQRAPYYLVRIELGRDRVGRGDRWGPIKLGMGGQVEIISGGESVLLLLLKKIRQTVSLG